GSHWRWPELPWASLTLLVAPLLVGVVWMGASAEQAVCWGLVYLQVRRHLGRRGADDDRVALLLSALMMVFAAVQTRDVAYVVLATLWVVMLPPALVSSAIGQPQLGTRGLSALTFGLACLSFIALPRCRTNPPDTTALVGFSDQLELGGMGRLLEDPAEVFRVRLQKGPDVEPGGSLYFRGMALGRVDGGKWYADTERLPQQQGPSLDEQQPGPEEILVEVKRQPVFQRVLFTVGAPAGPRFRLDTEQTLLRDLSGNWFSEDTGGVVYRFLARPPLSPGDEPNPVASDFLFPGEREARLRLPDSMHKRIGELAVSVAGAHDTSWARVLALRQFLRTQYRYTTAPSRAEPELALYAFLFQSQSGHCEYFASALAVMARAVGVPSRLVTGFVLHDDEQVDGWLVVRRSNAHAWTEVFLDDIGWVIVDATPGSASEIFGSSPRSVLGTWFDEVQEAWEQVVLDFDAKAQRGAVIATARQADRVFVVSPNRSSLRGLAVLLFVGALVVGAIVLAVRRAIPQLAGESRVVPAGRVARLYYNVRHELKRQGWEVPECLPPLEAARWVSARADEPQAEALVDLAWLFYRVHLRGELEQDVLDEAVGLAAQARRIGPPSF
ncbi:MAG: DUF3488 domain-containing protein, partial [Proteobacteria bacterium]|nr:DUF3488 domain-containing protein [Pseudomonadota bacterium]